MGSVPASSTPPTGCLGHGASSQLQWECFLNEVSPLPSQALYMFYALAIVCDDFFVPSLEKICEVCGDPVVNPGAGGHRGCGASAGLAEVETRPRLLASVPWQLLTQQLPGECWQVNRLPGLSGRKLSPCGVITQSLWLHGRRPVCVYWRPHFFSLLCLSLDFQSRKKIHFC